VKRLIEFEVNKKTTAAFFGVSPQALDGWVARGCPCEKQAKYLMFYLPEVVEWRYSKQDAGDDLDLTAERARLAKEQADKTGMENKRLRRDVFTGKELARPIDKMIEDSRLSLLAIPTKAAPHVLGCKTVAEVEGVLKTYVHESLNDLKSRDPHRYLDGSEDEAVVATTGPDNKPVGGPAPAVKS